MNCQQVAALAGHVVHSHGSPAFLGGGLRALPGMPLQAAARAVPRASLVLGW